MGNPVALVALRHVLSKLYKLKLSLDACSGAGKGAILVSDIEHVQPKTDDTRYFELVKTSNELP